MPKQLSPCPFCGSNALRSNLWSTDTGEEDAIECEQCYGSNLRKNWNNRARSIALKIPCHDEVPIYSMCAGVVTKTAQNAVQITDNQNQRYNYGNLNHTLKIDQIIEFEAPIGRLGQAHGYIELGVN